MDLEFESVGLKSFRDQSASIAPQATCVVNRPDGKNEAMTHQVSYIQERELAGDN